MAHSDHIGVVLPLHNSAPTLARAVASVVSQSHRAWSLVVIDDGSIDEGVGALPPDVCAAAGERLRVIRQDNAGVAAARNRGLDELDRIGVDHLMFLDADDTLAPTAMHDLVHALHAADAPGALGDFRFVDAAGRELGAHTGRLERVTHNDLLGSVFMLVSSHLVRREAMRGLRFDDSLRLVEDTDLWLRLAERGVWWARCPSMVTDYTIRASARSLDFAAMSRASASVYADAFERAREPRAPGCAPVDASPERLALVLRRSAFHFATRAAVRKSAGLGEAVGIMSDAPSGAPLEPWLLAHAAPRAVIMALAVRPDDPLHQRAWRARIEAWWQVCRARGWVEDAALTSARRVLEQDVCGAPPARAYGAAA